MSHGTTLPPVAQTIWDEDSTFPVFMAGSTVGLVLAHCAPGLYIHKQGALLGRGRAVMMHQACISEDLKAKLHWYKTPPTHPISLFLPLG